MKKIHTDKLKSILEEIKSEREVKGRITEYRDVHKIWELGLLMKEIIGDSKNPTEDTLRIKKNYDHKIFGVQNDTKGNKYYSSESDYAYDWVVNFQDKDYFLKICEYAGFREGKKNRFRKRDLRNIVSVYSKTKRSPYWTDAKRKKLEAKIGNDSVLELSAEQFRKLVVQGASNVQWEKIRSSLKDLTELVFGCTQSLDMVDEREKFCNDLGLVLISQLSAVMQLCIISKHDYKEAMSMAKQVLAKKSNSKNDQFQELFNNLKKQLLPSPNSKTLMVDLDKKEKLIPKLPFSKFEFEQISSYLDALQNESEFTEYFKRKEHLKTKSVF